MTRRLAPALATLLLAAAGCITPSLPVPPPEPESVTFNLDEAAETITYRAGPNTDWAGARVEIYNLDRTEGLIGVIVTADAATGAVAETPPFAAIQDDRIIIEYHLDDQVAGLCLLARDGPSSSLYECQ